MYKTVKNFDTWAILSAISLQNWFGLSKCWIKWGRRHKTFSGNPRKGKYRTKCIFWSARATVIFVFHGRSRFWYYISCKLTQTLSSCSLHWPCHIYLKVALIWKLRLSLRQQYCFKAWTYFCKHYCTNRYLQDEISHKSTYFIPVREYVYLFHLTGLLTVLTGGIFIIAAKTQKEIQWVLINEQLFWSGSQAQLPLFYTVQVNNNNESKFWYNWSDEITQMVVSEARRWLLHQVPATAISVRPLSRAAIQLFCTNS